MEDDKTRKLQKNYFFLFILIFLGAEAILFSSENFKLNESVRLEEETEKKIQIMLENTPIEAKAVSIYNATKNKKIYGKNDDVVMPIASLAKIMTVAVALNQNQADWVVSLPGDAINQAGDFGLFVNEKWKISDLAKFTLLASANDGAYALAEEDSDFLARLNEKAKRIGAEKTLFVNSTGLDLDLENAGAFASASDLNTMAVYALRTQPEVFSATTSEEINLTSESGFIHNFKNTNTIIEKIPNLLFSKTGFTEIAGGNLSIIFKDKRGDEIAVTILGSTFDGRFSDMEKIVRLLYNP